MVAFISNTELLSQRTGILGQKLKEFLQSLSQAEVVAPPLCLPLLLDSL
jgi:hypothetical protein